MYKHYGEEIVAKLMKRPAADPEVATIYLAVYKNFMEAIDAIDNGEGGLASHSTHLAQEHGLSGWNQKICILWEGGLACQYHVTAAHLQISQVSSR